MATTIEEFVRERGIQNLVHFTRVENLNSILNKGLVTRDVLNFDKILYDIDFIANDYQRLDLTNAVCTSISFPNHKIFTQKKSEAPGASWVVLEIDPSVMWETRCAFCITNAASNAVTELSIEARMGLPALEKMFAPEVLGKRRSELGIPDHFSTDLQAEVLLLDGADKSKIKSVYFMTITPADKLLYETYYPNIKFAKGGYFVPRCDWKHWKK